MGRLLVVTNGYRGECSALYIAHEEAGASATLICSDA